MLIKLKSFILPISFNYSFCKINNKNYFIVKNKFHQEYYYLLPSFVLLKKNKMHLEFYSNESNSLSFNLFFISFKNWFKCIEKPSTLKLSLKGLGYRINFLFDKSILSFKLGFSHLKTLRIPNNIVVFIEKNILVLQSSNSILIGNFAQKIKNLKKRDSYKGKGFSFKNESISLKEVKKK